jgi:IclR family transcriptional regulator, acetate operon repressor
MNSEKSSEKHLELLGKGPSNGNVHLLRRVMIILRVVADRPAGMNIAEISSESGMPRTTVQRLVEALETEGLLFSPLNSKLFRLGFALRQLSDSTDWSFSTVARPILQQLSSALNETVALALLNKDHAVYLDVVLGTRTLQAFVPVGTPMPLHSLASGKAMLAQLDKAALAQLRKNVKLQKFTDKTITSWARLDEELAKIRHAGYASDFGENSIEIGAFAVTFTGAAGELLAVSIAGPVDRIKHRQEELLSSLREARTHLQRVFIGTAQQAAS